MDLASLLEQPPSLHEATSVCTLESQARMAKAWKLGTQWLVWKSTEGNLYTLSPSVFPWIDGVCDRIDLF